MCGIAGIVGPNGPGFRLGPMVAAQRHRGPDGDGQVHRDSARMGFTRLAVLDPTPAADQPMTDPSGRFTLTFNGEIYNYRELARELGVAGELSSSGDTAVLLAAWSRWGEGCLDRLVGMFAFAVWDRLQQTLHLVRDRFGVKPLHLHHAADGTLVFASEPKALHAAGVDPEPDPLAWAAYLGRGLYGVGERSFWAGVERLGAGETLTWHDGGVRRRRWYDPAARVEGRLDTEAARPDDAVREEALALLEESVAWRLRSDVPVGVNLSGGLDSSLLFALVERALVERGRGDDGPGLAAYTFVTGDPDYDELPWVEQMLGERHRHRLRVAMLSPEDVPELAVAIQEAADEPYGGLPTLAYARLFQTARADGTVVLLDGQGLDEAWAGYDYYRDAGAPRSAFIVQGTTDSPVRPDCLTTDFAALVDRVPPAAPSGRLADPVADLQLRDLTRTKLPRALGFNDRVSMAASVELREPFLDHRLVELGLAQPARRKVGRGEGKELIRDLVAERLIPGGVALAPKRPVQTPQREWLRGPLAGWARDWIERGFTGWGADWLDRTAVTRRLDRFTGGEGDNSFYVWQWVSLGMMTDLAGRRRAAGLATLEGEARV